MSKYTAFRCPDDLLRRAKRIADSERRSLSNYIIWLLEEDALRRALRDHATQKTREHLHRIPNLS